MKKKLRIFFGIALLGVALFCAVQLILIWKNYQEIDTFYEDTASTFVTEISLPDDTSAAPADTPAVTPAGEDDSSSPQLSYTPEQALGVTTSGKGLSIDFDALSAVNSDIYAWIWIPGTKISYPVLAGDEDNSYLQKRYDGSHSSGGSIFSDYRCADSLSGFNTILYGHNMNNGSMFGSLKKFTGASYAAAHPYVYLYTTNGVLTYQIFSAEETTTSSDAYKVTASGLAYLQESANVHPDVTLTSESRVLTLSTCVTRGNTVRRYVVHAVLLVPETTAETAAPETAPAATESAPAVTESAPPVSESTTPEEPISQDMMPGSAVTEHPAAAEPPTPADSTGTAN